MLREMSTMAVTFYFCGICYHSNLGSELQMKCINFMGLASSLLVMEGVGDVQPRAVYAGSWVPGYSFNCGVSVRDNCGRNSRYYINETKHISGRIEAYIFLKVQWI